MKSFVAIAVVAATFAVASALTLPSLSLSNLGSQIAQALNLPDDDLFNSFNEIMKNCVFKRNKTDLLPVLRRHLQDMSFKTAQNPNIGLGLSCMSALTPQEFKQNILTLVPEPATAGAGGSSSAPAADPSVPSRKKRATSAPVDWRSKGYVSPVKDQGQCGSCWTFGSTGAIEGALFKKTGKLVSLSEQNLVDCVTASYGCNGGRITDAFKYVVATPGIDTGASYPYKATNGTCAYNKVNSAGAITSYGAVKANNETDLELAVAKYGPVPVAIDATDIQNYKSGVFKCTTNSINHAVLVVGFGTDSATGQDYWIVKNSWGTAWGESGYIRILKGVNSCGIAAQAFYPIA